MFRSFRNIISLAIILLAGLPLIAQSTNTVALTKDYLVIGDPNYQERTNTYSSIFIYRKSKNNWKLIKKFRPPEGLESNFFGENISIVNDKLYVSDKFNRRVYLLKVKNSDVLIENIYQYSDPSEKSFGSSINAGANFLLVGSSQIPDQFSKRKGLVHVFSIKDSTVDLVQTLYPLGTEHTGFGANILTGKHHEYLISSNNSEKNSKQGSIYIYKEKEGQLLLEAQIRSYNTNKHDGFADVMHNNDDFLFVREYDKKEGYVIQVYDLNNVSSNPVILQTIEPPTHLHLDLSSFATKIASSEDKLYITFIQRNGSSGILVYSKDCSDHWRFIQQILPQTKKQYQDLSLAAFGSTLAIGTQQSSYREYYDLKALDDGVVKLYEYKKDSSQIAYLEVKEEDSYISPSGRKHTYSHIFFDTIANHYGCDSIINIDLTITLKDEDGNIHEVNPNSNDLEDRDERNVVIEDTIKLESEIIKIAFFDHGQFDHDTISVKLNDKWILQDQEVPKEPKYIFAVPQNGYNRLVFRAENTGVEPPNTTTIILYDDENNFLQRKTLNTDLEKSAAIIFHR